MDSLSSEIIQNGIDAYLGKFPAHSRKIYWLAIGFVALAFIALPFIEVDISLQNSGMIRPSAEKTEIRSCLTESIDSIYVNEGQSLRKGDTILTFLKANPDFQIDYQQKRMADMRQLKEKERDRFVVVSPVSGTLDQFNGIYAGSTIQTGALLAVISPDSTLYAEIQVSPRDIGYITESMPVSIQVSSFDYNEWGMISGKVAEISSDLVNGVSGNPPCYKVKCSMDRNYLMRKNKIKGLLKKGMPVSAHFKITRRSLFDLLYQKMDDWANPAQYKN